MILNDDEMQKLIETTFSLFISEITIAKFLDKLPNTIDSIFLEYLATEFPIRYKFYIKHLFGADKSLIQEKVYKSILVDFKNKPKD